MLRFIALIRTIISSNNWIGNAYTILVWLMNVLCKFIIKLILLTKGILFLTKLIL